MIILEEGKGFSLANIGLPDLDLNLRTVGYALLAGAALLAIYIYVIPRSGGKRRRQR